MTAPDGQDIRLTMYQDDVWKAYLWWDDSEGDLRLQNYTRGVSSVNPYGGNVGIGTISHEATLDVDGDLRVRGDLVVDGNLSVEELLKQIEFLKKLAGSGTVTDIDGNVYNTIQIGNQTWMAENLKVSRFNDGTGITRLQSRNEVEGRNRSAPFYCFYEFDSVSNFNVYGALYDYNCVMNDLNVCPEGWHIPGESEWDDLAAFLGGGDVAGGKMKEQGFSHWLNPNTGATNESGFTALPGGALSTDIDVFFMLWWNPVQEAGIWWCKVNSIRNKRIIEFDNIILDDDYHDNYTFTTARSIRCIKD
jgi:uncharacterized protein (TIGR02145 family)